jgi:hypothetical protein
LLEKIVMIDRIDQENTDMLGMELVVASKVDLIMPSKKSFNPKIPELGHHVNTTSVKDRLAIKEAEAMQKEAARGGGGQD